MRHLRPLGGPAVTTTLVILGAAAVWVAVAIPTAILVCHRLAQASAACGHPDDREEDAGAVRDA